MEENEGQREQMPEGTAEELKRQADELADRGDRLASEENRQEAQQAYAGAIEAYQAALRKSVDDLEALHNIGNTFAKSGVMLISSGENPDGGLRMLIASVSAHNRVLELNAEAGIAEKARDTTLGILRQVLTDEGFQRVMADLGMKPPQAPPAED